MSYTPEQEIQCVNTWSSLTGTPVSFEYDGMWEVRYEQLFDGDEVPTEILIPLEGACNYFGLTPASSGSSPSQDPVGWSVGAVNDVVDGVGSIVGNILGIFGLGPNPANNDFTDPNLLQDTQGRQQMHFLLGFVAILGLILAGVYYSRKK